MSTAGIRWARHDHGTLRAKHRARLLALYNELFTENERQRVAVASIVAQLANNYVASHTSVRSAVDRAAAGFERLCSHSARLAVLADALRALGCDVDQYGNPDSDDGALSLGIGMDDGAR